MQVLTAGESSFVLVVLPGQSMHVCAYAGECADDRREGVTMHLLWLKEK